eukprot:UN18289
MEEDAVSNFRRPCFRKKSFIMAPITAANIKSAKIIAPYHPQVCIQCGDKRLVAQQLRSRPSSKRQRSDS